MKVVLLGYMTSGKSSVGKLLAKGLGYDFIDLDEEISTRTAMDIPTIFSEKGEIFFRKQEAQVLGDILNSSSDLVLSLGGGTPCYGNNMHLINEKTPNSFYLNLSIPSLVKRIAKEKKERPLVANIPDEELPEFVGKHLFERAPFYGMANHIIFTEKKTMEEVADELKTYLV